MLSQSDFYQALRRQRIPIIKEFAQGTYLPLGSEGACSFTTLDFHRAVSQQCDKQWLAHSRGLISGAFALRQQFIYDNMQRKLLEDPGFSVGFNQAELSRLNKEIAVTSRKPLELPESETPLATLAAQQAALGHHYLRLNFNVSDGSDNYGHVIAIAIDPDDPQMCQVMEPNAGVFKIPVAQLDQFFQTMQNTLYKGYTVSAPNVEQQEVFWKTPAQGIPATEFARTEKGLGQTDPRYSKDTISQSKDERIYEANVLAELLADLSEDKDAMDAEFPVTSAKDPTVARLLEEELAKVSFAGNQETIKALTEELNSLPDDRKDWSPEMASRVNEIETKIEDIKISDEFIKFKTLEAIDKLKFGNNDAPMQALEQQLHNLPTIEGQWTEQEKLQLRQIHQQIESMSQDPAIKKIHKILQEFQHRVDNDRIAYGVKDKIERITKAMSAVPLEMRSHLRDFNNSANPLIKDVHKALASHRHIHKRENAAWDDKTQTIDPEKAAESFKNFKKFLETAAKLQANTTAPEATEDDPNLNSRSLY